MTAHFDYTSVTIGYMAAGVSTWNGVFLADSNWCVPGMAKGGLLPAPDVSAAEAHEELVYGLPVALIVVKNLNISVKWSGQEHASLDESGGFLGPFSLAGASPTSASDGSWTYARPGMQVVALMCSHLPVLPPANAPDVVGTTTSTASAQTPSANTVPPATNPQGSVAGAAGGAPTSAGHSPVGAGGPP